MGDRDDHPERVLWDAAAFGEERHPAGRRYWWDNRIRPASGGCVQATLEGEIELRHGGRRHEVRAGSLMIFLYGEDSQYGRPEPLTRTYRCAWIGLEGAGLAAHLGAIRDLVGPVMSDEPGRPLTAELRAMHGLLRGEASASPVSRAAAIQRLVMSVYESAARHRRRALPPVERAVERLLSQPFSPENVQQIADRFGVSREHFTRVFASRHGRSPARHLAHIRAERAERLLRTTALSVGEIAEQVGVRDAHALARLLRRERGRSPTACREAAPRGSAAPPRFTSAPRGPTE